MGLLARPVSPSRRQPTVMPARGPSQQPGHRRAGWGVPRRPGRARLWALPATACRRRSGSGVKGGRKAVAPAIAERPLRPEGRRHTISGTPRPAAARPDKPSHGTLRGPFTHRASGLAARVAARSEARTRGAAARRVAPPRSKKSRIQQSRVWHRSGWFGLGTCSTCSPRCSRTS